MDYCKYHPVSPATFYCEHCETHCCDHCIDDETHRDGMLCYICDKKLTSLGSANTVIPFWRRLDASFKYPLRLETIFLIVGFAFLSTFVSFIPFSYIFTLLILAALLRYSFTCLQNTSQGEMIAPDITEAFEGGLKILGVLLLLVVIVSLLITLSDYLLGVVFTRLLSFIITISIPAILINYALTENIIDAINPIRAFKLVTSIGLPYGLLLAFIMIMFASISVIQHFIGVEFSIVNRALQASVSYYYMIVIFHIMGYIIFQFQKDLGFVARENFDNEGKLRSKYEWLSSKIDVHLKEGKYEKVVELFKWSLRGFSDDESFKRYFEFLLATKNSKELIKFAPSYFNFLDKSNRQDNITLSFKKILAVIPGYKPEIADLRIDIAKACYEGGDPRNTVKLINGIHKEFPDSPHLSNAYSIMAMALDEIPKMEEKAEQSRKLSNHFLNKNQ